MSLISDTFHLAQFAFAARTFLRQPMTVDEAEAYIRERMDGRDNAFLHLIERNVYGHARSPYLKLLQAAGCELDDVRRLVRQDGVEGALQALHRSGVYVSYEEFKGRTPTTRGSQTFSFEDADFDNPLSATHFFSRTGGTLGQPSTVRFHLDHIAQTTPHWGAWFAAHGWSGRPLVCWTPVYAAVANGHLRYAKLGARFVKWFSLGTGGTLADRVTATAVHTALRWAGGFPTPQYVPLQEAGVVADYLLKLLQDGAPVLANTAPSAAARISLAAQERAASLQGVAFLLRGEPLTAARRSAIEACGAAAVQTYGFSEGGTVGSQCPYPTTPDDIHIYRDAFAVITRPVAIGDGSEVQALLLTGLRSACPKVMLNTEIGDHAALETRRCECFFDKLGYTQHLHSVRSFEKLTGEGVTILGADIFHLFESVMPAKFGGGVADYQLVEVQDARSLPRYYLLVHPQIGAVDEEALVRTLLRELGKMKGAYRLMARLWAQGDLLRVRREPPMASARGKILPFRTLGRCDGGF